MDPPARPAEGPPAAGIASTGDPIPAECEVIEVRVTELAQLFNAIDPSPFHDRDLDPKADDFITGWSSDVRGSAALALLVHVERPPAEPDAAGTLREAVHQHFRRKADATRRRLRALFRQGRISLAIGVVFLGVMSWLANLLPGAAEGGGFRLVLRESLIIAGWVAMWRPMEVFLYDWWPIRQEANFQDRLAAMPVQIRYASPDPELRRS
jgi:hypothetical protein